MVLRFNGRVMTSSIMVMLASLSSTALAQSDEGILLQLQDNPDEPRGICIDSKGISRFNRLACSGPGAHLQTGP